MRALRARPRRPPAPCSGAADLLSLAFRSGRAWLHWLSTSAAQSLGLTAAQQAVLQLRLEGFALRDIAAQLGRPHTAVERSSLGVTHAATRHGTPTPLAAALAAVDAARTAPVLIRVTEVDPARASRWRAAVAALAPFAALTDEGEREVDVLVCSPFVSDLSLRTRVARAVVLSSSDPCAAALTRAGEASLGDPTLDDRALILTLARASCSARAATGWPLSGLWLRHAFVDALHRIGVLSSHAHELVESWIDCGAHKDIAARLRLGVRAIESRAAEVCRALAVPSLFALPLAVARMLDRDLARAPSEPGASLQPSRAEPSRAEPSRAEPSRAEPSRAEPSRAEPSRAEPSRAEPSRAEPREDGRLPSHACAG